jgi:serine/threonine-protein kinase
LPFEIGQTVSDYEILDVLGKGGMGRVYRVRNVISGRIEAMKSLLSDLLGEAEIGERFGSEIRTLARLDHPNIAKLHTAMRVGNELVMLMEFVEGITLTDRARKSPIPLSELLSHVSQTLCALQYAHQNGVVHRDIKPSNIMVTAQGVVKLMDFGIAKSQNDNLRTQTGMTMGSVSYMSPEQVRGTTVDARSDVYSMGIVLYELAVGRRPFDYESNYAVLDAQLNQMPVPPAEANPAIPAPLNDIILRALQKDPADRFQSAEEFRQHVDSVAGIQQSSRVGVAVPFTQATVALAPGNGARPLDGAPPTQVPAPPTEPEPVARPSRTPVWLKVATAVLSGLVVAAVLYLWLAKKPAGTVQQSHQPAASTATTAVPSVPANLPHDLRLPSGDMVLVNGGEAHLGENRTPTPVSSFYIDKTEVSLGAYRQFCREKSVEPPPASSALPANMPVTNVTFDEASQFAAWAGKRLPKAHEWELAARGLAGQTFPWGDTFKPGVANLRVGGAGHLTPVNSYPTGASPSGALNMVGNAWEWVDASADAPVGKQFEDYRENEFKNLDPPLSPKEPFYQTRGGSYSYHIPVSALPALVWDNLTFPARGRQPDVGFRCARDASAH